MKCGLEFLEDSKSCCFALKWPVEVKAKPNRECITGAKGKLKVTNVRVQCGQLTGPNSGTDDQEFIVERRLIVMAPGI